MSKEQKEFTAFFEASWTPCLRAVAAVVGSPQLAEEQVAEAFTRAFASWRKVRRHPAPQAWVVRTALNVGVSWWRRRSRELPLGDHDIVVSCDFAAGDSTTVVAALRRLTARQREVIALRVILDLDVETIGRQLGIAPATVRVHLARGVASLRDQFVPDTTEEVNQ